MLFKLRIRQIGSDCESDNWFSRLWIRQFDFDCESEILVQFVNQEIGLDYESERWLRLQIGKFYSDCDSENLIQFVNQEVGSDCESGQLKSATGGEEAKNRLQQQNRLFCPIWFSI